MSINPLNQGVIAVNFSGVGTVTRGMVRERATELAVINGRSVQETSKTDWDQAKRELTAHTDADPKDVILNEADESERWDPLPGSEGHAAPVSSSEEEDEDGRSDSARLVEEGVSEAEHDQMLQAARVKK